MKGSANKYLFILNIAIIAIFALNHYKDSIRARLDEWKLIPRRERFTELYFDDHVNLPKQIQKGEKIDFSFTIHNLEGERRWYSYIVYFKSQDGQITNIEEKSVFLEDGELESIKESYAPTLEDNKGGIFVELKNPQQGIDFLLSDNK